MGKIKENKPNMELLTRMYETLKALGNENNNAYLDYISRKDELSDEEKKAICAEQEVVKNTFLSLKKSYEEYKSNGYNETDAARIVSRYGSLFDKYLGPSNNNGKEIPVKNRTELRSKPILDEEKVELKSKPVLDTEDKPQEKPVLDGLEDLKTVGEWCDMLDYDLINPRGFTAEQLASGAKINMDDFFNGLIKSDVQKREEVQEEAPKL